jgi:hypothetical protein
MESNLDRAARIIDSRGTKPVTNVEIRVTGRGRSKAKFSRYRPEQTLGDPEG